MSATATRPKESKSIPVRSLLIGFGIVVVIAVVAVFASRALRGPSFVPSVTVVNPSPYVVDVDVTASNSTEWTQLASITPKTTSDATQVVDQGDFWKFRAASAGVAGGEFTLTRSQLEQANWKITIPASVIARFAAQNVPEAPLAGY
jgi:hypothetical protein